MERKLRANSLTIDEQAKLISVCDNYEDIALFKLALSTGIRREDIVMIETCDIDLNKRTLKFWEGKKKRQWTVPLTDEVSLELKRYYATKPKKSRYLFDFSGRTAYNKLQRALIKAGITNKEISFHDLRRSFVKTAKKKGLMPQAVAQITGDKLSTIELYYSNLDMEELKEQVNKL
jgi:integrase/recombinase XerD